MGSSLYEYVIRITVEADSKEEVENQLEDYDFNNAIDKGLITPEINKLDNE